MSAWPCIVCFFCACAYMHAYVCICMCPCARCLCLDAFCACAHIKRMRIRVFGFVRFFCRRECVSMIPRFVLSDTRDVRDAAQLSAADAQTLFEWCAPAFFWARGEGGNIPTHQIKNHGKLEAENETLPKTAKKLARVYLCCTCFECPLLFFSAVLCSALLCSAL